MSWRAWLDASPVAHVALALMRDATGRVEPPQRVHQLHQLAPLLPTRPAALAAGMVIGLWSLTAGAGCSTLAALLAHRSASGGVPPVLVDLDRRAPSLALIAGCSGATVADALLRPGAERGLLSRWENIRLLPGSPELRRTWDGPRLAELVTHLRVDAPVILDLGSGAEALDADVLDAVDHLCVVVGPTVAQLQAAFCSVAVLERIAVAGAVVVGATDDDAARIGARLPWRLLGAVPRDPFLAADDFAARAPTVRAIDTIIRALR